MRTVKLKEFVKVEQGENPERLMKKIQQEVVFYDQESFETDGVYVDKREGHHLYNGDLAGYTKNFIIRKMQQTGDIIISLATEQAVIGSPANNGKVYTLNFVKLTVEDKETFDPYYLLYLFNESSSIKRQLEKNRQGSSGIKRLTLRNLENLEIPVRDAETHQKIGQAYKELLELEKNLEEYKSGMKIAVKSLLEKEIN